MSGAGPESQWNPAQAPIWMPWQFHMTRFSEDVKVSLIHPLYPRPVQSPSHSMWDILCKAILCTKRPKGLSKDNNEFVQVKLTTMSYTNTAFPTICLNDLKSGTQTRWTKYSAVEWCHFFCFYFLISVLDGIYLPSVQICFIRLKNELSHQFPLQIRDSCTRTPKNSGRRCFKGFLLELPP